MQSIMQLEAIQSDMSAALAAAREAQGGGLVLQDSLAKVTTLIETLVNHKAVSITDTDILWQAWASGAACMRSGVLAKHAWFRSMHTWLSMT